MRRLLTAGLASLVLCGTLAHARGQAPAGGGGVSGAELAQARERLIAQCPSVPAIPEADAAKLPIHITRWGTSGPRVVLIHGGVQGRLGGGPATFDGQQAWGEPSQGEDGFRVERVDRPGFGQSPSRGVDDMERDSVWIADLLGSGANLIGHSWGGAEALLAAARRPDAVQSLVLVEPALFDLAETDPNLRNNPAVKAGAAARANMVLNASSPAQYAAMFAKLVGTDAGSASQTEASASAGLNPSEAQAMGCALLQARMAPVDVMQRAAGTVAQAGIPVLIVTGGWNHGFDSSGEVIAKMLHGRHIVVRSPNHFVQLANAADFNREVAAFMRDADRMRAAAGTR